MERSSGIIMHISSLPSPYGIGALGGEAHAFVDFLKDAGQSYWQTLPVGPTGYGDSPYQCFSTFAGNPNFIDLELLAQRGLLERDEAAAVDWGDNPEKVDFGKITKNRPGVLRLAYKRGWEKDAPAVASFAAKNAWLYDYALFMALKTRFNMRPWPEWDEDIRLRRPEAVRRYGEELRDEINFNVYAQYLFFSQWTALRGYMKERGIKLIGDLPIYVPLDSADVWAAPENFQLDENRSPIAVAGVPPDYFSATGQLWGAPLYDWDYMARDCYRWWIKRIEAASRMFDVIRIDHFRGLESYWSVRAGEETAANGRWVKGPGMAFIRVIQAFFPCLDIIAEDLGYLTEDVKKLLCDSGYPGMKVLQFAFDSREPSDYLPHTYPRRCVAYTGTHDNTTAAGWFEEAAGADVAHAKEYLGLNEAEGYHWGMLRGGAGSVADLFIAQMQDYLGKPGSGRMNTPGVLGGNWMWRVRKEELASGLSARINDFTKMYGR